MSDQLKYNKDYKDNHDLTMIQFLVNKEVKKNFDINCRKIDKTMSVVLRDFVDEFNEQ